MGAHARAVPPGLDRLAALRRSGPGDARDESRVTSPSARGTVHVPNTERHSASAMGETRTIRGKVAVAGVGETAYYKHGRAPRSEFALALEPYPYDPAKSKQLLAEAGYPNGFDAGDLYPYPPYFSTGETIAGYFGAVGIKIKVRTMERAALQTAWASKKLHGLCMCTVASYGNAATRLADQVPSEGAYARGADPDIDALYRQQARETDRRKREATLHQIQQLLYERVRFGPLWEFIWPSGIGPRVAEPALMLIDPYPWSAPLEEVRLKPR